MFTLNAKNSCDVSMTSIKKKKKGSLNYTFQKRQENISNTQSDEKYSEIEEYFMN